MTQVCAQALDKQRRELDLPNDGVAAAAQKTAHTGEGWAVSCLACPMTVEPRPTVEQAVQDSRDHWQVWHSTKEERA